MQIARFLSEAFNYTSVVVYSVVCSLLIIRVFTLSFMSVTILDNV